MTKSNPKISPKAANRFIVEQLTARPGPGSGARESRKGQPLMPGETLPAEYKPTARKYTAIIVSLPIVFVIGYMLFERQFLGVEKKEMPMSSLPGKTKKDVAVLESVGRPGVAGDEE